MKKALELNPRSLIVLRLVDRPLSHAPSSDRVSFILDNPLGASRSVFLMQSNEDVSAIESTLEVASFVLERGTLSDVVLERRRQSVGPDRWSISNGVCVWTRNAQWEHEPIPSPRDDAYLERARYATVDDARAWWAESAAKRS